MSNLLLEGEEQRVREREECEWLGVVFNHPYFFDIDKDETRKKKVEL
jgi:hypothetical protein